MNGGFVALTVIGAVLAFIALSVFVSVHSAHTRAQATGWLAGGLALAAIPVVIAVVRSPGLKRSYAENVAQWRAYSYVWQNALICMRCYGAFLPGDRFPAVAAPTELIHVDQFHAVIADIGARLYQSDRAAFGAPSPLATE